MTRKVDKILERWKTTNQNVSKEEVERVLDTYFSGCWRNALKTSHEYQIVHPILSIHPESKNTLDVFVIPVVNGKHVKRYYYKRILKLIEQIEKEEANEA